MKNIVRVGVGVYIINEKNQILLGLRKSKHGEHTWCPPGGHLELGESFEQCAIRETKEETNLDINEKNIKMIGITNDIFKESGKHYITIHMMSKKISGQIQTMEKDKCLEWSWFNFENLPHNLFLPVDNFLSKHKLEEL